jgi:hypothetical protein
MASMCAVCRLFAVGLVAMVLLGGCNENRPIDIHPDSYIVVEHITDGDKYVIRHNDLEIEAACRNTTFTTRNDRTIHATNCLDVMPVGKEIRVTRGVGGLLWADWNEADIIDWQMHLNVEREELKQGTPPAPIPSLWAITIGTFLGVIVALLLLALVFSKKRQLREALREHRRERRVPASVDLELSLLDVPSLEEPIIYQALIENTSPHGARVVVRKPWRTDEHVLVRSPRWDKVSPARVAYSLALGEDAFAIGLQFPIVIDWIILLADMSKYGLTSHPYRK